MTTRPPRLNAADAAVPHVLPQLLPDAIPAGTGLQIGVDQVLQIDGISTTVVVSLSIVGLVLRTDGILQDLRTTLNLNVNDTLFTTTLPCPEGWLLWISVSHAAAGTARGLSYARVILRSLSSTLPASGLTLLGGYPSLLSPLSWPGGRNEPAVGVRVRPSRVAVGNPAPGADWSVTLAAQDWLHLWGWTATLTTDVNVAVRTVRFVVSILGVRVVESPAVDTQIASLARIYFGTQVGFQQPVHVNRIFIALPNIPVPNTGLVGVETENIQVGDQWSGISVYIEANNDV